jgi:hypothetical protein
VVRNLEYLGKANLGIYGQKGVHGFWAGGGGGGGCIRARRHAQVEVGLICTPQGAYRIP